VSALPCAPFRARNAAAGTTKIRRRAPPQPSISIPPLERRLAVPGDPRFPGNPFRTRPASGVFALRSVLLASSPGGLLVKMWGACLPPHSLRPDGGLARRPARRLTSRFTGPRVPMNRCTQREMEQAALPLSKSRSTRSIVFVRPRAFIFRAGPGPATSWCATARWQWRVMILPDEQVKGPAERHFRRQRLQGPCSFISRPRRPAMHVWPL